MHKYPLISYELTVKIEFFFSIHAIQICSCRKCLLMMTNDSQRFPFSPINSSKQAPNWPSTTNTNSMTRIKPPANVKKIIAVDDLSELQVSATEDSFFWSFAKIFWIFLFIFFYFSNEFWCFFSTFAWIFRIDNDINTINHNPYSFWPISNDLIQIEKSIIELSIWLCTGIYFKIK